jgi:hypothetical protein
MASVLTGMHIQVHPLQHRHIEAALAVKRLDRPRALSTASFIAQGLVPG